MLLMPVFCIFLLDNFSMYGEFLIYLVLYLFLHDLIFVLVINLVIFFSLALISHNSKYVLIPPATKCSKLTIETLEQGVKYIQSKQ